MGTTGNSQRFRPGQQGSAAVWLLTILLLLFALATGYVWYKYSNQSDLLSQRESELTSLEFEFERLQRDLDEAMARTDTAERRIAELERRLQQLQRAQARTTDVEAELERFRRDAAALEGQLAECRERAEKAQEAQAALQSRIVGLEGQLESNQEEKTTLQAEITELKARIQASQEQKTELKAEVEALSQPGEAEDAIARLEKEVEDLRARLASCHGKLEEMQKAAEAAAAAKAEPEPEQDQPTQEELAAQAEAQRRDCSALAAELEALRTQAAPDVTRIAEMESGLQQCRARAEELQEDYRAEKQMADAYQSMIEDLRQEIHDKEVSIERIRDRLEINILGNILFNTASTRVTPQGREVLDKIMPSLQKVEDRMIYIVGHTDDVPIAPNYRRRIPSNWELSAGRAASVVRHLIDNADIPPGNLAAVGMSEYHPEADNDTVKGRALNRRVEIIVGAPILGLEE